MKTLEYYVKKLNLTVVTWAKGATTGFFTTFVRFYPVKVVIEPRVGDLGDFCPVLRMKTLNYDKSQATFTFQNQEQQH